MVTPCRSLYIAYMTNDQIHQKGTMLPIQVAIVDDSQVIREGLIRMLSKLPDVELIWQAA